MVQAHYKLDLVEVEQDVVAEVVLEMAVLNLQTLLLMLVVLQLQIQDQVVVEDQVLVQQIQEEQETHLQFHPLKEQTVVIMYTQLHLTHKAVAVVVLLQRVVVDQVL